MRRLEALRLVQWYHFQDETLPIGASCLLLGDNGSGKSTILDAIQLALVADLGEVRFNQAANEKGRRTLHGYVRWKLGHEDESKGSAVRYGRAAATSYVMLEFRDSDDPAADFTAGIALEANETDSEVARFHFVLPGCGVGEVPVVTAADNGSGARVVRPLRDLRAWVRDLRGAQGWTDPGTYREEIRQRLGVLPESFHRLIVKALSFKPIGQVRQFVFDYLLDPRPIDTAALQANLEHYKRLEGEARQAEARLATLDEIVRDGERIRAEQRTVESHRYLELRSDLEAAELALAEVRMNIERSEAEHRELIATQAALEDERISLEREHDRVRQALEGHETYRQLQDLERQLDALGRELKDASDAEESARRLLGAQREALDRILSEEARAFRRRRGELLEADELFGAEDAPAIVARLSATLAAEGTLGGRDLATWERRLDKSMQAVSSARLVLAQQIEAAKKEGAALEAEQKVLETGRHRYDDGVAALLHLLAVKLRGAREPRPLCELIEVPSERWRDAVEGYLNTRRFDVIVAPEDYPRALSLYERHKRDYPLPGRGPVFIGGVGLVDIEKIQRQSPRVEHRSLAEQVETEDPYARAYCDYVLGDVVCVDDEQSLRKHRSAITDSVMVYRNYVARQTPRHVYSRHFIGSAARLRRLKEVIERLAELSELVVGAARDLEWLERTRALVDRARVDAARLPDLVKSASSRPQLELQIARIEAQRGRLDRNDIAELAALRQDLARQLAKKGHDRDEAIDRKGKVSQKLESLRGEIAPREAETGRSGAALAALSTTLETGMAGSFEEKYQKERVDRSPAEIHDVFERQRRGIESRISNWTEDLREKKLGYANLWGFAGDTRGAGFSDFAAERDQWRESRLPEYREKIAEAKRQALVQLAEDVVFRLRENLSLARRQIDELNRALKDVTFGADGYQFIIDVEPEHKAFHDLVMDAGRFDKTSLFGDAALKAEQTQTTLRDLIDRLVEAEASRVKTELEARADYREYFRYDLKILHADGRYSMYDRVAADKSGGETQTPYYIAILASMFRMYRSGKGGLDGRPSAGIVLLDEAFGKMDEARIAATLRFARRLGLQLILATPKERSELLAPNVERSIYVHKDPVSGEPMLFEVTKEYQADEGDVGAAGDPDRALGSLRA
ncbi:MAG: hypothetical protein IT384_25470 [Deltaproteobacteria bacterium]|nr:hypothetical protein [Deltaproteobacteria bacterium]